MKQFHDTLTTGTEYSETLSYLRGQIEEQVKDFEGERKKRTTLCTLISTQQITEEEAVWLKEKERLQEQIKLLEDYCKKKDFVVKDKEETNHFLLAELKQSQENYIQKESELKRIVQKNLELQVQVQELTEKLQKKKVCLIL